MYKYFIPCIKLLTSKLLEQGYEEPRLKASLKRIYGQYHDLVDPYNKSVSKVISDILSLA